MKRALAAGLLLLAMRTAPADEAPAAPAFTHAAAGDWINSAPLSWSALTGQVVLLEVWTCDCWNCGHSAPWARSLTQRLAPLRVIGVHTPELPQEYRREHVLERIGELGIRYPVMLDNDYSYWNALGNRYWPAWYLVDKHGRVRAQFAGEVHAGDAQAQRIEAAAAALIAEP